MNARLSSDDLLALVPAVYRTRDVDRGVLAGLLEVLAGQAAHVEDDLVALLDDWFVETCAEWVVPYLGDLLAARPLHDAGGLLSQRAWVAETIAHRRRKGTLAMLESLARAVTGWPTVAVEFHRRLASTQHLDHVRPAAAASADLRGRGDLHAGVVDGPFDPCPHLADVRSIAADRGRHNVPHVGLFMWRQAGAWLPRATLRPVTDPSDGRYHVHPLGLDLPLHHRAGPAGDDADLAGESDVPVALRRRPVYDEVTARRQATVDGDAPPPARWFGANPVFTVHVRAAAGDPLVAVPPEQVAICDLSDPVVPPPTGWRRPSATVEVAPRDGGPPVALPITVGVDPTLGRVAFPAGVTPDHVEISAHVGVLADTAGGPYSRAADVDEVLARRRPTWQIAVSAGEAPAPGQVASLGEAVAAWNAQPDGTVGVIAVADSHRYAEDLVAGGRIRVGEGSLLLVVAAGWPATPVPGGLPGETQRLVGTLDATERRPVLVGDVEVDGTAPAGSQTPGVLVWHGVWVDGGVTAVAAGGAGLRRLELRHTTVTGGVDARSGHVRCEVALAACAAGPVTLDGDVARLSAADTVLVDAGGTAIDAGGVAVALDRVTVLGSVAAQTLEAGDCIFVAPVTVARRQTGCVRHSWVARGSATARRYRCQPDLAVQDLPAADADVAAARTAPAFTAVDLGHPALGDLQRTVTAAIAEGAADGGAMGAHGRLATTHRLANLATGLDEYLPVGLAAGVAFVT